MRQNLRVVAVALLCVLVIGFAAATLSTTVDPSGGSGTGPGEGPDSDSSGDMNLPESGPNNNQEITGNGTRQEQDNEWDYCYQPLDEEPIWVPLIAGTLVVGFGASQLFDRWTAAKAMFLFFWPFLIVIIAATAGCDPPPSQQVVAESLNNTVANASQEEAGGGDRTLTTPTSIIAILFVVAALGLLAAAFFRDDGEETQLATEPEMDDETRQAVIGSAAGEAADRIEAEAELENEVYRAWAEMAEPLPVDHPETSTPAEFAQAARDTGLQREDVDELTDLFEQVRYSTAAPTEEREKRAVEALRRIERHYSESSLDKDDAQSAVHGGGGGA